MDRIGRWLRFGSCVGVVLASTAIGCRSYDEARVLQALNQRGFGRKYVGDANEVLTVGVGDTFTITEPNYVDIAGSYTVRLDGVVSIPLVGEVFVAGFTTEEIAEALNERFSELYTDPHVHVQLTSVVSKRYYVRGEVLQQGVRPLTRDTTVFDAVMQTPVPITADLSNIHVIRADPRHPLVIPVDLSKMIRYGDSSDNILLREDDIVVVRPNLVGWVKRGVELLLAPVIPLTRLAVSVRNLDTVFKSFQQGNNFFVGSRGFGVGFGGGGFGGQNSGGTSTFSENPQTTPPNDGQ